VGPRFFYIYLNIWVPAEVFGRPTASWLATFGTVSISQTTGSAGLLSGLGHRDPLRGNSCEASGKNKVYPAQAHAFSHARLTHLRLSAVHKMPNHFVHE
jgi:hypothetical protein